MSVPSPPPATGPVTASTPATESIAVLLVDDYELVRQGLRLVLNQRPGIRVVGEAWSGAQAVEIAAQKQPDIILLDLELGMDNGLDFLPRLLQVSQAKVIVFTGLPGAQIHNEALALGAKAVAVKGDPTETLVNCIRCVHSGQESRFEPESLKIARLSALECHIVTLLCAGSKTPQIYEQIGLGASDFQACLGSIESKLGVRGPVEIVIYAFRCGLVTPDRNRK